MAVQKADFDDPAHWHERDISCHACESVFSFNMHHDSLGRQDRSQEGIWVTTKCPGCRADVPFTNLIRKPLS